MHKLTKQNTIPQKKKKRRVSINTTGFLFESRYCVVSCLFHQNLRCARVRHHHNPSSRKAVVVPSVTDITRRAPIIHSAVRTVSNSATYFRTTRRGVLVSSNLVTTGQHQPVTHVRYHPSKQVPASPKPARSLPRRDGVFSRVRQA